MKLVNGWLCVLAVLLVSSGAYGQLGEEVGKEGYLSKPPLFIDNDYDLYLSGFGILMPKPGRTAVDFDALTVKSDEFRENGVNVQPDLTVKFTTYRLSALYGINDDLAAGVSIPYRKNEVSGAIGGYPANRTKSSIGDIALVAKKLIWRGEHGRRLVVGAGLELPTGPDDAKFNESNPATNGYYPDDPQRMPLGWQTGTGTVDGYVTLAYGQYERRLSYVGLLAGKLYSAGDDDVKIGNTFVAALDTTYGVTKQIALSLGMMMRTQADDSYPNVPPPGVNSPLLAGTTTHGTEFLVTPALRFTWKGYVTVGLSVSIPVVKPDNGFVRRSAFGIIFYPNVF